jgi:hypothetical protein
MKNVKNDIRKITINARGMSDKGAVSSTYLSLFFGIVSSPGYLFLNGLSNIFSGENIPGVFYQYPGIIELDSYDGSNLQHLNSLNFPREVEYRSIICTSIYDLVDELGTGDKGDGFVTTYSQNMKNVHTMPSDIHDVFNLDITPCIDYSSIVNIFQVHACETKNQNVWETLLRFK